MRDFADVLTTGKADAALAASLFHFQEIEIPSLKTYLSEQRVPVRLVQHQLNKGLRQPLI
jgi:cyclase